MGDKTKKFGEFPNQQSRLNRFMDHMFAAILEMSEHKGSLVLDSLEKHFEWIPLEDTDAVTAGFYDRGQIVNVELGFNPGSELGGNRPAIVLWTTAGAGTVTIIPLTSRVPREAVRELRFDYQVGLGAFLRPGLISIAKVQQMKSVSKLRVKPWLNSAGKTVRLSGAQLDLVDQAILRLYTRQPKKP